MSLSKDLAEFDGYLNGLRVAIGIISTATNLEEAKSQLKEATQVSFEQFADQADGYEDEEDTSE